MYFANWPSTHLISIAYVFWRGWGGLFSIRNFLRSRWARRFGAVHSEYEAGQKQHTFRLRLPHGFIYAGQDHRWKLDNLSNWLGCAGKTGRPISSLGLPSPLCPRLSHLAQVANGLSRGLEDAAAREQLLTKLAQVLRLELKFATLSQEEQILTYLDMCILPPIVFPSLLGFFYIEETRKHLFFPHLPGERVVRFYVSCLLPASCLPPACLLPASCLPPACLLPPRRPSAASCLLPPPAASCLVLLLFVIRDPQCSLPDLNHDHPRPVFPAGPQPRPSPPSVPCRTSTTTIPAQCSLPDLNHDHPRPVFPAGPQPRPSQPSVPCRTSNATSRSQWALPTPKGKNVRKDVR